MHFFSHDSSTSSVILHLATENREKEIEGMQRQHCKKKKVFLGSFQSREKVYFGDGGWEALKSVK